MKSFIVLVFMIFALVGSTKAEGWTNAGEFSYLYPNGTKQITDYTLTEDGKSLVVITAEGNNIFRLNKFDLVTGVVEFDTLWTTTESHRFKLSKDGLTVFDIEQYGDIYNYHISYKLFDIFHSSKGYLFNEELFIFQGNPHQYKRVFLNYVNFLSKDNLLIYGTTYDYSSSSPQNDTYRSEGTSGTFNIFDITNPNFSYSNKLGETHLYDCNNGMNNIVFHHNANSSSTNQPSTFMNEILYVDSNKKETIIFSNDNNNNNPKMLKLFGDSLLILHRVFQGNNHISYYNIKNKTYQYNYKFPLSVNNSSFQIAFSNDWNYFAKTDNLFFQFYKSFYNYPIFNISIPDTINNLSYFIFSQDAKYILSVNKSRQIIRFENPLRNNTLNALFTISDSITIENAINKTFNCTTGNPSSYLWDFGNGITSTEFQPDFNYEAPGKYTISLTAEKDNQKSTQQKVITVLPNFKSDFEIVSIPEYPPIICKFKNTSSEFIDSLIWDFGDGTYSKSKDINIDHQYAKESEYNVKLKVYYNKFCDSIEKKVIIKDIKEVPLEPNIYSEYVFENTSQNHQKFYKMFETTDYGYILMGINKDTLTLFKTSNDFAIYKTLRLNKVQDCPSANFNELYFNNFLTYNKNRFVFSYNVSKYMSLIGLFDENLTKIKTVDSVFCVVHYLLQSGISQDSTISTFYTDAYSAYINKYDLNSDKKTTMKNFGPGFYFVNPIYSIINFYYHYFALTPISNNYSVFSAYNLYNLVTYKSNYQEVNKTTVKLVKQIPFQTFRNIDTTTFVGLDTLGNIYKFNAKGDSLNKIALTKGLRNIAVNGSLYYAVGFKDNHPICYAFDNNLNMKDTIYIEQRDGAFLDALVCKSGDLVLAGYKYIPSKTDTAGKLLRSSYILKINKYSDTKDTTKSIPISITNPIDHLATIRIKADTSTTFRYEIYDLSGNLVFKTAEQKIDSDYTGQVDFSGLAPGVYIFKFYINGLIETKKVIYQK